MLSIQDLSETPYTPLLNAEERTHLQVRFVEKATKAAKDTVKARIRSRFRRAQVDRDLAIKTPGQLGLDLEALADDLLARSDAPSFDRLPDFHVDHIVPLCDFGLAEDTHDDPYAVLLRAFAPENLRWLSARQNHRKGGKTQPIYMVRKAAEKQQTPYKRLRKMSSAQRSKINDPSHPEHGIAKRLRTRYVERQKRFNRELLMLSGLIDSAQRERILKGDLPRFRAMLNTQSEAKPRNHSDNPSSLKSLYAEARRRDDGTVPKYVTNPMGALQDSFNAVIVESKKPKLANGSEPIFDGSHNARPDVDLGGVPRRGTPPPKSTSVAHGAVDAGDGLTVDDDLGVGLGGQVQAPPNPWMSLDWAGGLALRQRYGLPDAPSQIADAPKVQVPAPPKLNPDDDIEYNVRTVVRAYRDAVRKIWGDGKHLFVGMTGAPRRWRTWGTLVKTVEGLIEHDLSPIVWATWTLRWGWLAPKEGKARAKTPPPIQVLFAPDKIKRFRGWCRSETKPSSAVSTRPPAFVELSYRWHKMKQKLIFKNAPIDDEVVVREIIEEFLPGDTYNQLLAKSREEAQAQQEKLNSQAANNIWIYLQ